MTALTGEELAQSGTLEELYDKLDKVGMGRGWNKPTPSLWASPRETFGTTGRRAARSMPPGCSPACSIAPPWAATCASSAASRPKANTGQFVIALDVARFLPLDAFAAEIDRHVRDLRASARLAGVNASAFPASSAAAGRTRSQHGVALEPALLAGWTSLSRA
jgi:hypothetical protein